MSKTMTKSGGMTSKQYLERFDRRIVEASDFSDNADNKRAIYALISAVNDLADAVELLVNGTELVP